MELTYTINLILSGFLTRSSPIVGYAEGGILRVLVNLQYFILPKFHFGIT